MKRIKLTIVSALITTISWGQTIVEDFNYKSDSTLTSNGWTTVFSKSTENAITVNSSGLTYARSPASGIGFSVNMTTSGQDVGKFFKAIATGSFYMSFLVNVSAAQGGDNFIGIMNGPGPNTGVAARAFIKKSGKGFVFGLGKSAITSIPYENTVRTFGATYLVVLKYTFNSKNDTDDTVDMWVNPVLGAAPTNPQLTMGAGVKDAVTGLTGICLRQGNPTTAPALQLDGIRTGVNWGSVTAFDSKK